MQHNMIDNPSGSRRTNKAWAVVCAGYQTRYLATCAPISFALEFLDPSLYISCFYLATLFYFLSPFVLPFVISSLHAFL